MSFAKKVQRSIFMILTIAILGFITEALAKTKFMPESQSPIIFKTTFNFLGLQYFEQDHDDDDWNEFGVLNFAPNLGEDTKLNIRYYEGWGSYPDSIRATQLISMIETLKSRTNSVVAEGEIETNLGDYNYAFFTSNDIQCVLANHFFDYDADQNATKMIFVLFCAKRGYELTLSSVTKLLKSIGISGFSEKTETFSTSDLPKISSTKTQWNPKGNKALSGDSNYTNSDAENKLKEARSFFEQGLISEEEYDKLRDKILGLD